MKINAYDPHGNHSGYSSIFINIIRYKKVFRIIALFLYVMYMPIVPVGTIANILPFIKY